MRAIKGKQTIINHRHGKYHHKTGGGGRLPAIALRLVHELALFERAPGEVTVTLEHFTESGFGENPVWWAYVVCVDEKVEGFALYYIRYSTWKGQRLFLEDLIVTENRRGQGLGKLLFGRVLQEAEERKFHGMAWQVLDWNEAAIRFYKKYDARFDAGWINCSIG